MTKKELKAIKAAIMLGTAALSMPTQTQAKNIEAPKYTLELKGNPYYGKELQEVLEGLDENIQNKLNDEKLKIVILDSKDGAEEAYIECGGYSSGSIMGFTEEKEDSTTIYVEGVKYDGYYEKYPNSSNGLTEDEFYLTIAKDTLLQEIGRYLNFKYNLSDNPEIQTIYNEESEGFTQTSEFKIDNLGIYANMNSVDNYVAIAISCFIKYPEELKTYCPKTYKMIEEWIKTKPISKITENIQEEQEQQSYNILINNIEIWGSPHYAEALCEKINKIDPAIQQYLVDKNVHIAILDNANAAEGLYTQMEGYCPRSIMAFSYAIDWDASRIDIYIEADNTKKLEEVIATLYHEIGHSIDSVGIHGYSNTTEAINYYNQNLEAFMTTYEYQVVNNGVYANVCTSSEFYAEVWAAYLAGHEDFKEKCRELYNYIDGMVDFMRDYRANNTAAVNSRSLHK